MGTSEFDLNSLTQRLAEYNQEHLVRFWNDLDDTERGQLYNELTNLDLGYITQCFKNCQEELTKASTVIDDQLEPLPDSVLGSLVRTDVETLRKYEDIGLNLISRGQVAVLLLAGGQGTRLGVDYPKGMYDVGLPSRKTLYHLQAQRIARIQELAAKRTGRSGVVPWYIMTSEQTREKTEQFFAQHKHFGLDASNIKFFEQSTMPCIDLNGRIMLETRSSIAKAPDGNGGLYSSLKRGKILEDLEQRGIQYLHVYCVDNILVKMADPVFIGFCINKGACCGAKVVEKTSPTEPVGVICRLNGKYHVVEYSEISLKTAEKRDPTTGKLIFNAGGIANHFFTVDFMKLIVREKESLLKHHVAKKKIPYCDENGRLLKPTEINGIKMEKFIFDIFEFASSFAVWEVPREEEFAPLKNADGSAKDTPTTSRHDLLNLHHRWAVNAGAQFVRDDGSIISDIPSCRIENNNSLDSHKDDSEDKPIIFEISPLVSYNGEGLEHLKGRVLRTPQVFEESPEEANV